MADKRKREYKLAKKDAEYALHMFSRLLVSIHDTRIIDMNFAKFAQHEFLFNVATSYYWAGQAGLLEATDWPVACNLCKEYRGE